MLPEEGISVLIPVKGNRGLNKTIKSIAQNRRCNLEILVLRNGEDHYTEEPDYLGEASLLGIEVRPIYETIIGWIANTFENKADNRLVIIYILLLTIMSTVVMIPINIARIWGMVTFRWRRLVW